ncbi:MAG: hypothetical protein ACREE6_15420, partial [Limisphaerales bacterium]
PGFIVAGGGTGTNPVRAKFNDLLAGTVKSSAAWDFLRQIEDLRSHLEEVFPEKFHATKRTIADDLDWMKQQLG